MKEIDLVTLVNLLHEAREWVTDKPWDDHTYLHKRISEALGLPVEYADFPYDGPSEFLEEETL